MTDRFLQLEQTAIQVGGGSGIGGHRNLSKVVIFLTESFVANVVDRSGGPVYVVDRSRGPVYVVDRSVGPVCAVDRSVGPEYVVDRSRGPTFTRRLDAHVATRAKARLNPDQTPQQRPPQDSNPRHARFGKRGYRPGSRTWLAPRALN